MGVLVITFVGLIGLFIPCYLGIRLGASFATILGVDSMVPLTLLIILPIFKPPASTGRTSRASTTPIPRRRGRSSSWPGSSSSRGTPSPWRRRRATSAECRDPARDAKIALTAEGLYGVFVYIGTAIVFVGVLGASLKTADPLTLYTSFCRPHLRQRRLGQVRHRHPADLRPAAVGAQRHHGGGPIAVPGLRGPAAAPILRAQEQAPRAGPGHGVQPGVRASSWACSARRCASTSSPTSATSSPWRRRCTATSCCASSGRNG